MSQEFNLGKMSDWELQRLRNEAAQEGRKRQFRRDWDDSWRDLRGRVIDREGAIGNILADPTEEESQRWLGMTSEEIKDDINRYLDRKEDEHISGMRLVAEVDQISREIHIESSPRLARYRRPR
ncbi:hypothetical protein ACFL0Y_03705 [Patescibacteria group bacterium]